MKMVTYSVSCFSSSDKSVPCILSRSVDGVIKLICSLVSADTLGITR